MSNPRREHAIAALRITIDGNELAPELDQDFVDAVIDERLHQPTLFELRFRAMQGQADDKTFLADKPTLKVGAEVEIKAGWGSALESLCTGRIVAIEVDLRDDGPSTLTARGYDHSYKLHHRGRVRAFQNVTDGDLVKRLAGEADLNAKADPTSEQFPYIAQHGESNYAFLLRRADRLGFELRVEKKDLLFRKPAPNGAPVELTWGDTLKAFRPRHSVAEQVDAVEVRGWDVKQKQAIVGTATASDGPTKTGVTGTGPTAAGQVWGAGRRWVLEVPVESQNDATAIAQALLDDLQSDFVTAEGECSRGDGRLHVGKVVKIAGIGQRFAGEYYLTGVVHRLEKSAAFQTAFVASTQRPAPLAELVRRPAERAPTDGVIVALVTNNKDPDGLGRVRVKYPTLDDQMESAWARLATPMAGGGRGWLNTPEVNDEVLVAFEHGDPRRPYVLGALWNGKDAVPDKPKVKDVHADWIGGDGKVNLRYWRSRAGHVVALDDSAGKEGIYIIDKTGKNFIKITSSNNKLTVEMDGDVEVTSVNGKMDLKAKNDITITSETGNVKISAQQNIETRSQADTKLTAGASMTIQVGANYQLQASGSGKIQTGAGLDLQSGANLSLTAGATFSLSASATVSVTGGGPVSITGPVINLN